jgi:hypothetical protein
MTSAVNNSKSETFLSSISKYGVSRPNRFEVQIISPNNNNEEDRMVSLRCETVDMPGRTIDTQVNDNVYGPTFELGTGLVLSGSINMTFLLDEKYIIKKYFDNWHKKIYDETTYDMYFYDDYVKQISIQQLDYSDTVIYSCGLSEAYPKTVELFTLDNNSRNEYSKLNVTMAFRDWFELPI